MAVEVHIAPGMTAAGSMKYAFPHLREVLLVNVDMLSYGPLRRIRSLDEWRQLREEYLRNLYPDWPDFSLASETALLANAAKLRDAERIILWIGTGLAEQLLLVWTVQLLRAMNIDPFRLRVIQFVREPTKGFEVRGVGILSPEQLRAHPPDESMTKEKIQEIDAAWNAVTASDPIALLAFISDKTHHALPHLRHSLNSLIYRFPDSETGLNYWESELLRYTQNKGPVVARVIGYTMGYGMDGPDWVGDEYLFARLRRLADSTLPHPFASITGSVNSMRDSEVTLTETGLKALAGELNFVELNGIDDQVGGVHLESSKGSVWFRKGDSLILGS